MRVAGGLRTIRGGLDLVHICREKEVWLIEVEVEHRQIRLWRSLVKAQNPVFLVESGVEGRQLTGQEYFG